MRRKPAFSRSFRNGPGLCSPQRYASSQTEHEPKKIDKKCLILDDIPDNTYLMRHTLNKHGVKVITRTKGEDALEVFKTDNSINAIITDLRMPEMSGQAFMMEVRKIEAQESRHPVPIIVVTAESDPEEKLLCLSKYGANDFLVKPIKLFELLHSLYKAMLSVSEGPTKNVLIVEDDTMAGFFLARVLIDKGLDVITSPTLAKAREILKQGKIDLLLLDNMLPDGSGKELLEFIATELPITNAPLKVISMSGNSSEDQRRLYEGYEVATFLQKPLSKSQILGLIR